MNVISTEVFAIEPGSVPALHAYRLDMGPGSRSTIGGKLAYRLRRKFGGHWIWWHDGHRILTDTPQPPDRIAAVLEALWKEQPNVYGNLQRVTAEAGWQPSASARAAFVANGLFDDADAEVRKLLAQKTQDLGNAFVERVYDTRDWVVQGEPAVSISVSSRLVFKQDLKAYAATQTDPSRLIGLSVADKFSSMKGEVTEIAGTVGQHRTRLLALTQNDTMREVIEAAPDNEPVVRVLSGRTTYDYAASALRILVLMEDFGRFHIDGQQALRMFRMDPDRRLQLVGEVASIARRQKLIRNAFTSASKPSAFVDAQALGYRPSLRFGGGQVLPYDERGLLRQLREAGLHRRSAKVEGKPLRIGVLNAVPTAPLPAFLGALRDELQRLGFTFEVAGEERLAGASRADVEAAVHSLEKLQPHLVLALLPGGEEEDDGEWGLYNHLKSLTIGQGLPSQVVYDDTIRNKYALGNIVLGVLGKTGNVPFVLAEPLPYADMVVGIDIARRSKERLAGSMNATAIARIYFRDGEFLRYVIHDAPLEGETVPENVLQGLFPRKEFEGKRVVVHRDGYFRGDEKQALRAWGQKIGAEFALVEVIKSGSPRLYGTEGGRIRQPLKGSALKLSDYEALLVSSLPPFENATPQPLRIRTEPPFRIDQGLHSVLSLTLLHYGSLRPPRLPVTIHYSDRIAYLALQGIKPKALEGSDPFWL